MLFLLGDQLHGEMVLLPRSKYVAFIRDALIGGNIPQRIEEFECAVLRLIQSVYRNTRELFVSLRLNGDAYFALTQVGGSGVVYGDTIAYRRTASEQEGESEGEDPFHDDPKRWDFIWYAPMTSRGRYAPVAKTREPLCSITRG